MTTACIPSQTRSVQATLSRIPGDKSISHRAIIIGSLSESACEFRNFLTGEDCLNTLRIFQSLGVPIEADILSQTVRVQGVGLQGLKQPTSVLDVGNAGTGIRL